jgi:hypothetical protein
VGRFPDDSVKEELAEKGVYLRPSLYGEPYPITARLIADGEKHLMLKTGLDVRLPGADPAGRHRSGCATHPRVKVFGDPRQRRDADPDQGRRSPALHAGATSR